jgi:hypothetical protein
MFQLQTPVAFLIFNRPDTTARVFEEIRRARPPKLLVVADGPRAGRLDDADKCSATRAIIGQVDWDCEVLTNFADTNMGCKHRVASGLDWVFASVPEAIILEDDCLPHPTFFRFCQELLERYRDEDNVMCISGDNFQFGRKDQDASYYFSRYLHIWGWASWRRAWQHYDVEMRQWSSLDKLNWLKGLFMSSSPVQYWATAFQSAYSRKLNTWDYQWLFAMWMRGGLSIAPNVNLISNIGFSAEGTHTTRFGKMAEIDIEPMLFPLLHQDSIHQNAQADLYEERTIFRAPSLVQRIASKVKRTILPS